MPGAKLSSFTATDKVACAPGTATPKGGVTVSHVAPSILAMNGTGSMELLTVNDCAAGGSAPLRCVKFKADDDTAKTRELRYSTAGPGNGGENEETLPPVIRPPLETAFNVGFSHST